MTRGDIRQIFLPAGWMLLVRLQAASLMLFVQTAFGALQEGLSCLSKKSGHELMLIHLWLLY